MNARLSWQFGGASVEVSELLWDRGLRFGMSVFETVAIHEGRPVFLEQHLARLRAAAADLLELNAGSLCDAARQLPDFGGASGVVRFYLTAGPGGLTESCIQPMGFALFESMEICAGPGAGLRLALSRAPMAAVPGGWKTGNYWQNLRALQSARREGFEEAAVAGVDGSVLGAATGNLFVVKDRRLLTPPVASGARPGVVRAWVIEQAGAQEFPLTFEDLLSAEEIFLTNSRLGIATVRSVESVPLATTAFAQALASDYREQVLLR